MYTINYVDTPSEPLIDTRVLNPAALNFNADWRVVKEADGEVILSNISAPLSNPETLRIAYSEIGDVFKGTKIDAPAEGSSSGILKRGCSILIQMNGVGEDADGVRFPHSAHLVLKLPYSPDPNGQNVQDMLCRLLGSLYDTRATTVQSRLEALLRGAVTPVDL